MALRRASVLLYAVALLSGGQYLFIHVLGPLRFGESSVEPSNLWLENHHKLRISKVLANATRTIRSEEGPLALRRHPEPVEERLKLQEYCKTEGSLNEIVFKMANHSSPPDSASFNKLKRILNGANSFHIYLMISIFRSVKENIATMLQGYGLAYEDTAVDRDDVIRVETTVRPRRCVGNCSVMPRIVIQCEQLAAVGDKHLKYLQDCHLAENCIIWDFSDFNIEWAKDNGFADSVVLFPTMIQSRLDMGKRSVPVKPLVNRSMDVAFFGSMMERRKLLRQEIRDKHNWTMHFGHSLEKNAMVKAYRDAKVCLVAHSINATSGGEYHRLSEFATMGCVPVMEEFADTVAIGDYRQCGGVVFSRFENLIQTVERVLKEIEEGQRDNKQHVDWWKRGILWKNILVRMLGEKQAR